MKNKKLKSKIKNLKAKERKILLELLEVKLDNRVVRRELIDCKAAKAELGMLKQKLKERVRVGCHTNITPMELKQMPDDAIKWQSESMADALVKAMAKTFDKTLIQKIEEELQKVTTEEMFTPPYGTLINVTIPVFRIDIDALEVTAIDKFKEKKE